MANKEGYSRREFIRTTALGSVALMGTPLQSQSGTVTHQQHRKGLPYINKNILPESNQGVVGLLFSQIGYEQDYPIRIVVRLPHKRLGTGTVCRLVSNGNQQVHQTECLYWGTLWGSHWWTASFSPVKESGLWDVEIVDNGTILLKDSGLKTGENILWNSTAVLASVDILERRSHFTNLNAGWQDAGTLWVESCSQSAMIIALTELLLKANNKIDKDFKQRIYKQIIVGSDYLVMTQEKAKELGYPDGAMSHDLFGHEKDILPNDAAKAVVALMRAARLLPDQYKKKKIQYKKTGNLTMQWLLNTAKPLGSYGFSFKQRGIPDTTPIPADEFQTRVLIMQCWGTLEAWKNGDQSAKDTTIRLARRIMQRQIPIDKTENGFFGHFYEYASLTFSQKSWSHGIVDNKFGADLGGFYPNYIMPFIEMLRLWPDHPDADEWKNTLHNFAYGYLLPGCQKNPFQIVPLGIYGKQGALWFTGTFHGTNTIYGYTAALALELAQLFNDHKMKDIAYANMQWLAGLNAGITRENLKAAVIYSRDLPEDVALPVSMMCQTGEKWAGSWFATRGIICNGFSTGTQFKFDVEPLRENDGPFSFTDEDWIPHSAAWLTGLVRL